MTCNKHKLKHKKFWLNIKKKKKGILFTVIVIKHWNRLSGKVVKSPSSSSPSGDDGDSSEISKTFTEHKAEKRCLVELALNRVDGQLSNVPFYLNTSVIFTFMRARVGPQNCICRVQIQTHLNLAGLLSHVKTNSKLFHCTMKAHRKHWLLVLWAWVLSLIL